MHFLSHYYCELPNTNPYFVAALAIPDLTNHFTKAYNSVIKNSVLKNEGNLEQIHQGIHSHYAADKRFHNSEPFMQHLKLVVQHFINEGLNRQRLRLSVIAHLAVELLLDRQLVLTFENICNDYYAAIDSTNENILTSYFDRFSLVDEKQNFLIRFNFFRQRKFLFLFKDLENIVFGLNRIYSSVTGTEFTNEEKLRLDIAINNIDGVIRYSWKEILNA
jgi:hypothetical protein